LQRANKGSVNEKIKNVIRYRLEEKKILESVRSQFEIIYKILDDRIKEQEMKSTNDSQSKCEQDVS
jgi:hypothetical protein